MKSENLLIFVAISLSVGFRTRRFYEHFAGDKMHQHYKILRASVNSYVCHIQCTLH